MTQPLVVRIAIARAHAPQLAPNLHPQELAREPERSLQSPQLHIRLQTRPPVALVRNLHHLQLLLVKIPRTQTCLRLQLYRLPLSQNRPQTAPPTFRPRLANLVKTKLLLLNPLHLSSLRLWISTRTLKSR